MPTPNTADAMKRHKAGKAGFTDKAHLKAKGLIPRADGTKKKSPKYEVLDKKMTSKILADAELMKLYNKAMKTMPGSPKQLEIKKQIEKRRKELGINEDMDRQPQDKDVKKVKGTQPKKYYKTLDKDTKKKRAAFFKKKAGTYKKSDDDDDYKAAPGDEKAKTKKSTFTKKFKQMYGDNYGYTAMHSKPVAKLNPLRRKDESK